MRCSEAPSAIGSSRGPRAPKRKSVAALARPVIGAGAAASALFEAAVESDMFNPGFCSHIMPRMSRNDIMPAATGPGRGRALVGAEPPPASNHDSDGNQFPPTGPFAAMSRCWPARSASATSGAHLQGLARAADYIRTSGTGRATACTPGIRRTGWLTLANLEVAIPGE